MWQPLASETKCSSSSAGRSRWWKNALGDTWLEALPSVHQCITQHPHNAPDALLRAGFSPGQGAAGVPLVQDSQRSLWRLLPPGHHTRLCPFLTDMCGSHLGPQEAQKSLVAWISLGPAWSPQSSRVSSWGGQLGKAHCSHMWQCAWSPFTNTIQCQLPTMANRLFRCLDSFQNLNHWHYQVSSFY